MNPSDVWREVSTQETVRLGELALALGKITPRQLEKALARQQEESPPRKLAEILEEQGALTPPQTAELLLEMERLAGKPTLPRLDRFLLLHELGRGGMGVVWEAWDTKLNRAVALKLLRVDGELDRACLLREARMAGRLSHPNIPSIHEILEHQGSPCIAMSLIRGTRLDEAAPQLPLRKIVELVRDAARAIHYAHTQQVIHRDVKPENLMLDAEGKVYVMDFGLAKATHPGTSLSTANAVVGTPAYMPPEQALGRRGDVGPRSDVYGLGATLYTLVAGRPPFDGKSAAEVLMRVANDEPVPLRKHCPAVPREIETIVHRALAKEPRRRYASAAKFADDLDRYLRGEPILARPSGLITKVVQKLRKRWTVVGAATAVVLAVAVVGIVFAQKGAATRRRAKAQPKFDLAQAAFERAERMSFQSEFDLELQREEYRKALALLDETLLADPSFAEAFLYRGRIRRHRGDRTGAYDDFDAAIRLQPSMRKAYLARGLAQIEDAVGGQWHPSVVGKFTVPDDAIHRTTAGRSDIDQAFALADSEEDRLFAQAMIALTSNDMAAAISLLDRYLDVAKTDGTGFAWRGLCHFRMGGYSASLADYDRSLGLQPNNLNARVQRATLRLELGNVRGAEEDLQRLPRTGSRGIHRALLHASILLQRGDAASARSLAQDLSNAEPRNPTCRITLASSYCALGQGDQALQELNAALKLGAHPALVHINRSAALRKLGRFDEALAATSDALGAGATPFVAGLERALTLEAAGRTDEAVSAYADCLKLGSTSPVPSYRYGSMLCHTGRHEEAIAVYRDATSKFPFCAPAEANWGNCEMHLGRFDESLRHTTRALKLDPKNASIRTNRGILLTQMGRFADARTDFDKVLSEEPKNTNTLYARGKIAEAEEKWEEAAADFEAAAQSDPQYAAAFFGAGLAWTRLRRFDKAMEIFDEGLQHHPSEGGLHGGKGTVLLSLNRPAEAELALRRALELEENPQVRDNLAVVLCRLNRKEEAIVEFRKILEKMPGAWPTAAKLASLLLERGEMDQAAAVCHEALKNDPSHAAEYKALLRRAEQRSP